MREHNHVSKYKWSKLKTAYVVTDILGNVIFRYHRCSFGPPLDNRTTFMYPVIKIVVITKGFSDWTVGKNVMHVEEGDIMILRPGTPRRFESFSSGGIEVDMYEFLPIFLPNCEVFELFLMDSYSQNTVLKYNKETSEPIFQTLETIKKELASGQTLSGDYIRGEMLCALVQIVRGLGLYIGENYVNARIPTSRQPQYDDGYYMLPDKDNLFPSDHTVEMSRVANIISENISGVISIDDLAAAAHMSRSHFFKVFKRYTGLSVNDYILTCRVENTVRLILETKCNVLDAAYASGFTSSSGFYKAFRKITGCTPKEYINKKRKDWENN